MPDARDPDASGPLRPSGPPLGADREIRYRKHRSWLRRHLAGVVTLAVVAAVLGAGLVAVVLTWDYGDTSSAVLASSLPSASTSVPPPAPVAPPAATTSAPPPPAATPTGAETTVRGNVQAVNTDGSWSMKTKAGPIYTVVTSPATTFAKNAKAGDVRKGTTIVVTGSLANAVLTASKVAVVTGS